MAKQFHGEGYSQDPLDGEEAARHRHMFERVDAEWTSISNAATVLRAIHILSNMIRVAGPIAALGFGIGAYIKSQGWL